MTARPRHTRHRARFSLPAFCAALAAGGTAAWLAASRLFGS